ncbi:MAG: hypothetical protein A2W80_11715 [Candidatus Riflebacteria bacterium GWC2_50_8]|nr:MAG: hypothetical protein A2W80_11715 [Candidatus Riflebacteria bacterium GWC2_50_8]
MRSTNSGYIFPLILMATLSIGFFTMTLVQLQSSHHDQLQHLNNYQHALNLAYSVNVEVLSELREKQWDERFFKDKPVYRYNQKLFGGIYDVCIEDYEADKYTFNVKIRTTLGDSKNLFYWRQKYMPNMLDFTRLTFTVAFGEYSPELFEPAKKSEIDKMVDDKLKNAEDNRAEAAEIAENLKKEPTLGAVISKLGALSAGVNISQIKGESQLRPSAPVLGTQPSNQPKVKATEALADLKQVVDAVDQLNLPASGRNICNANLMIRAEPWGTVVSTIPPGATLEVLGLQGDFFEVSRSGTSGYSHINWIAVPGHTPSGVEPPRPPGAPPAW